MYVEANQAGTPEDQIFSCGPCAFSPTRGWGAEHFVGLKRGTFQARCSLIGKCHLVIMWISSYMHFPESFDLNVLINLLIPRTIIYLLLPLSWEASIPCLSGIWLFRFCFFYFSLEGLFFCLFLYNHIASSFFYFQNSQVMGTVILDNLASKPYNLVTGRPF